MLTVPLAGTNWRFRDTASSKWLPATVPGCVHTDLRANHQIPDPYFGTNELGLQWIEERDWEYKTTFNVTANVLAEEVVELVADGLDTVATVRLNGVVIADRLDNMYQGHRWPVGHVLRRGRNQLAVTFTSALRYIRSKRTEFKEPRNFNDPVGHSPRIRKQPCQFGWDWGPRFVTAGIWRDIRLEAWTGNRLCGTRIEQRHRGSAVTLVITPELEREDSSVEYQVHLALAGQTIVSTEFRRLTEGRFTCRISSPQLWWPAGQGGQPLYDLAIRARDASGRDLGALKKWIGLRTIELDLSFDRWGERFRFVVNGRPIFLKGANWIPAHCFVATLQRSDYARDLRSAVAANMNAVRVWGGGIYESEDFYDLCDELGLLVWQDFMFSCSVYPSDEAFLKSVRIEATQQVKRLRHRACLALWCGNNEIPLLHEGLDQTEFGPGYRALFDELLPQVLKAEDPITPYWPSSPWRGNYDVSKEAGEKRGDTHFWDVWHARHPVKDYEKWSFRFVSEFGMQSYSSPETNASFCPSGDRNVFGPTMENHQKNRAGNQIILDYVSRRYRFPRSQDDLIYLSQLNQAYCMQVGVEHYRRLMPRCMGALYWQLNDCWPVASWSSIEFTGRWKALHFFARRFFAPALVTAHVPGDESAKVGNYRQSTVRDVHLYTVYDAPEPVKAVLSWQLWTFSGRPLSNRSLRVNLRPGESQRHLSLELDQEIATHGRDNLYLQLRLQVAGEVISEQSVFLSPPRFLALPRGTAAAALRAVSSTEIDATFTSPVFLHAFAFEFTGRPCRASDNYFDLYPNQPKTVRLTFERDIFVAEAGQLLRTRSLVDTYES